MSSVALFLLGVGGFMMFEAYYAIHNKGVATPLTRAKAALQ